MSKQLNKTDLAYNAIVDARIEAHNELLAALERVNRLGAAAEYLLPLKLFPQFKLVNA